MKRNIIGELGSYITRLLFLSAVLLHFAGSHRMLAGPSSPEVEPQRAVQIGEKIDDFGQDFQFFLAEDRIYFAYLDFGGNRFVEGYVSEDWRPEETRGKDLQSERHQSLGSFLVFQHRGGVRDILFSTRQNTCFWSHEDQAWSNLDDFDHGHSARQVSFQRSPRPAVFLEGIERGKGSSIFEWDFEREELNKVEGPVDRMWDAIGHWGENSVLAVRVPHTFHRGDRLLTGSRYEFYSFDFQKGPIENMAAPPIVSEYRFRNARFVSNSSRQSLLLRDNAGIVGFRLDGDEWEGRRLENVREIDSVLAEQDRKINVSGIGGFDLIEKYGNVYVLYHSVAGAFLQVWDKNMNQFVEYFVGDFAAETNNPIRFLLANESEVVTFSKENQRPDEEEGAMIVDLVIRSWHLDDLPRVREGTFEELQRIEVKTKKPFD